MQNASDSSTNLASLMQTRYGFKYEELLRAKDLIALLGLDSLALVDLIAALETHFGVMFEPEDLVIANFSTLRSMQALLDRKLK